MCQPLQPALESVCIVVQPDVVIGRVGFGDKTMTKFAKTINFGTTVPVMITVLIMVLCSLLCATECQNFL